MVAMKRRAWLFSILTLVCFIGAALIMGARVSDAERANGQMVPVVIAKKDIAPQSTLTEDLLELQYIPAKFVGESMIQDTSVALNHRTVVALKHGDYITKNVVRSSADVNSAQRTFSLISSSKVLIEPSIRPGDRVDVLGAYHDKATNDDRSVVIVSDLEVLGVTAQGKDAIVTLSVTVDQAQQIMRVENFGNQLRIVKRGV
jgi:Flp pilus assembly protein CpaB